MRNTLKATVQLFIWLVIGLTTSQAWAKPAFWVAENSKQRIYLFGSIHVGLPSFYPLEPAVTSALQQSDKLWLEIALDEVSPQAMRAAFSLTYQNPPQPIKERLKPTTYQLLLKHASALGLSEEQMSMHQTWFITMLLGQTAVTKAGYQPELGIDLWFLNQARQANKPVIGLEDAQIQFAALASLAPYQDQLLEHTLAQMDDVNAQLQELTQAWQQGDQKALVALLEDEQFPDAIFDQLNQKLLVERNQNWLAQLKTDTSPTSFVVVGAMHMAGPDGLLALLEKAGYKISRLN